MSNRLAQSKSLYLRKHADNPIDWWPWCDEALENAQTEDKPIFLSVGYSSCHWCTVMEGEAFSDRAIADYMNANFLPIKVDREERPDLDSIYMQALQMMVGQGGWPLNIFLTPDERIPFYGGTYFPMEAKYGRPGFLTVLKSLRDFYDTKKEQLASVTGQIFEGLQKSILLEPSGGLGRALLHAGLDYSAGVLSSDGPGTRFPMIPYADAALRGSRFQLDTQYDAAALAQKRGLDLALGGIYDHVGGGFHRYTVDPTWTVPHFEKMLYDNGQIVEYLANLWSVGIEEPAFERAIAKTVEWLQREMTAPEGYFYAAQDADSFVTPDDQEPEEGTFYAWKYAELEQVLTGAELAELMEHFTISVSGNFEGQNVLQRKHFGPLDNSVEQTLKKLYAARYGFPFSPDHVVQPARNNQDARGKQWPGRIPPVTDTKMIVAWNSLMISGLARAAVVFQRHAYYKLAAQATQFILTHQRVNSRLHRLNYDGTVSISAQSEDYALFIKALLDLHQGALLLGKDSAEALVHDASTWLSEAVSLQAECDEWLWSVESDGYFNTARDASNDLVIRERSFSDNATPAANGIAAANLVRLALSTEDLDYLDRAEQTLLAFSTVMNKAPQACPSLFAALDWFQTHTLVRSAAHRLSGFSQRYLPTTVLQQDDQLPDGAIALVCEGLSCNEPAMSDAQLNEQLMQGQLRQN
ncbi:MAG: thioredoxin domain-containing protein [Cyanobacteria bacterium P01_A01_bin.37]